ncbi:enoyl-CoA hydratase/isomerase family protein [Chloroflexota bacterium]
MVIEYSREGKIAYFTINHPEAYNAMNVQGLDELGAAMSKFKDDPEAWVGIITGAGDKAFCAGADIKDMLPFLKENLQKNPENVPATHFRGLNIWKPLIAAINGVALGGGLEIALACDIRIASEKAKLGVPEVSLGLIPGWGGTQRLARLVPGCIAAQMLFTGKPVDAAEAYRIGLVNAVVPPEEVMAKAREVAEAILKVGPLAVRAAKEAMTRGAEMDLEAGLTLENDLFAKLLDTEDYIEGIGAFREKRKPEFKAT